jgi:hypothetical protein
MCRPPAGVSEPDDLQERTIPFHNELFKRPAADLLLDASHQLIFEGTREAGRTEIIPPALNPWTEMG